MSQNVGTIYYEVDANTAKLIEAARDANQALKSMGDSSKHVDGVTKSVNELGKEAQLSAAGLTKMQKALLGVATIGTAATLAKIADDYRAMGERVLGATDSLEEYELVQGRLLESANKTFRPLAEAQELFIATSGNIRDYGYSLEEALDITDSMSYGFVRNAASADKAQSAIRAYDASLSTGKVNAMQWLSISGAIDTLAIDMGEQMGLTAREIDKLGFSGQITAQMLNDALLKAFKANKDGADAMANTIEDAFVAMRNNLSVYVGELNKSVGATDLVAKSIIFLSENISTLATLMAVAGSGAAAKYVTKLGLVTVAKMKDSAATRANNAAELQSAKTALDKARAEVIKTAAIANTTTGRIKNTRAIEAETLAIARLSAAEKAMTATSRTFLSVLGGPAGLVGLLTIGVTAFAMFASSANEANVEITLLKKPIEELTKEIENMTIAQRKAALSKAEEEKEQAIKNLNNAYEGLAENIGKIIVLEGDRNKLSREALGGVSIYEQVRLEIEKAKESGEDLLPVMSALAVSFGVPESAFESLSQQNGLLSDTIISVNDLTEKYNFLTGAIAKYNSQNSEALALERELKTLREGAEKGLDRLTTGLRSQMNTLSDNGSALKKYNREYSAELDALKAKGGEETEAMKAQHKANQDLAAAIDEKNKAIRGSRKEYEAASNTIREMQKELELATLSGKELAIARAEQRLNDFATEQDVQAVRNLAAALYDLNQAKKFGETDQEITATITGQVSPLSGGAFDDQYARYEAEMVAEQERYAAQLERLREARELQLQTQEEFNDLEYNLQQTHADRMAQIEQAKNQVILSSFGSAFDAMAGIMEKAHGDQSSAYKAMFALSQGFAFAEAGLNISKALSQVLADPSAMTTAQKLANYGMIASEGTRILSSIGNIAYGGGRQYGGPVAANKMYRVNETGEPEIFNSGGRQYFLPNQKGEVVPAGKGGAGGMDFTQNLTINIEVPMGMDTQEVARLAAITAKNEVTKVIRDEHRPGGAFYRR